MLLIINEDFGYVAEPNFCLKFSLFVKIKKRAYYTSFFTQKLFIF